MSTAIRPAQRSCSNSLRMSLTRLRRSWWRPQCLCMARGRIAVPATARCTLACARRSSWSSATGGCIAPSVAGWSSQCPQTKTSPSTRRRSTRSRSLTRSSSASRQVALMTFQWSHCATSTRTDLVNHCRIPTPVLPRSSHRACLTESHRWSLRTGSNNATSST